MLLQTAHAEEQAKPCSFALLQVLIGVACGGESLRAVAKNRKQAREALKRLKPELEGQISALPAIERRLFTGYGTITEVLYSIGGRANKKSSWGSACWRTVASGILYLAGSRKFDEDAEWQEFLRAVEYRLNSDVSPDAPVIYNATKWGYGAATLVLYKDAGAKAWRLLLLSR